MCKINVMEYSSVNLCAEHSNIPNFEHSIKKHYIYVFHL